MRLGDLLERIFILTGIKRLVNYISKITGKPCGCDHRKEKLNQIFKRK